MKGFGKVWVLKGFSSSGFPIESHWLFIYYGVNYVVPDRSMTQRPQSSSFLGFRFRIL